MRYNKVIFLGDFHNRNTGRKPFGERRRNQRGGGVEKSHYIAGDVVKSKKALGDL